MNRIEKLTVRYDMYFERGISFKDASRNDDEWLKYDDLPEEVKQIALDKVKEYMNE